MNHIDFLSFAMGFMAGWFWSLFVLVFMQLAQPYLASMGAAIFNLNDGDDRAEYDRLRGLIFGNRPASIAA